MCAIASAQIVHSKLFLLSAWKGGGFGMFSTVDSPAARFLRIFVITADGEVPVLIPDALRRSAHKLRTTGSEDVAGDLARALVERDWVTVRVASAVEYYRHLLRVRSALERDEATSGHENPPLPKESTVAFQRLKFVRMLDAGEVAQPDDEVLDVRGIRVELWRYRLEGQDTLAARRELIADAVRPR